MTASVDGRIVTDGWPLSAEVRKQYEEVHAGYDPDGWICGRVTMEPFAGALRSATEVARDAPPGGERRVDFHAPREHDSFAFAVDPDGRLAWESSDIDGDQSSCHNVATRLVSSTSGDAGKARHHADQPFEHDELRPVLQLVLLRGEEHLEPTQRRVRGQRHALR